MSVSATSTAMKSVIGILLSIALFFSSGVKVPVLDETADAYFKDSISKAGVSYGVCRIINATVSIIKESSVELEPAGVGLSLAVGQAVDPINDMVERLSNVVVMSITSLGVQELTYEISQTVAPQLLSIFLLLISVLVWCKKQRVVKLQRITMSVIIIIFITRFCLPISSLVNDFLQENFFQQKIAEANTQLAHGTADLEKLKDVSLPKYNGIMETIENSASYLKQKTLDYKNAITTTIENRDMIVENLLKLTLLYVGIFVIQVLIIPLLVFWLFMKIVNSIFLSTAIENRAPVPQGNKSEM
jgi:hypothetical protein